MFGRSIHTRPDTGRLRLATFRPTVEALEDRLTPSWTTPPTLITPPDPFVAVALNTYGDAHGSAAITLNEIDYYGFTAAVTGYYRLSALTPRSSLDTVLAIFDSAGGRLA